MVWNQNTSQNRMVIIGSIIICGIIASILLSGNGVWMIAGYNMLSSEKKEKIDAEKLSKFCGMVMLFVTITMVISLIYLITGIFFLFAIVVICFVAIITAIVWGSIRYIISPLRTGK